MFGAMLSAILLMVLSESAHANTEIVNFAAGLEQGAKIPNADWPLLSPGNNRINLTVSPALLGTPMHEVCIDSHDASCPHEGWLTLDLSHSEWEAYSKFTLRISWPAFHPAAFNIDILSPTEVASHLQLSRASAAENQTRVKFARIRVLDEGVFNPSFSKKMQVLPVPFIVVLEPLYLGVLPASLLPLVVFLVPFLAIASVLAVQVHKRIAGIADDARRDISKSQEAKFK